MQPDDPLGTVEAALIEHFGHRPARASVSFVGVEPIDVLRFEPIPGERAYVSLGAARHPMVGPAATVGDADGPRAELVLHLRDPLDAFADVWRSVAVLAAAPAVESVVYRRGMTVDVGFPLGADTPCTGVLAAASSIPAVPTAHGAVEFVRVIPALPEELAWCRAHGADALLDRWRSTGTDLLDLARQAAPLG